MPTGPVSVDDPPERRRVGRPPRISRALIAEAAHEIGLNDLSLKAVAKRLDVSVAGLYHHIEGREDLLRLAAEHGALKDLPPHDVGQHWAVYLREWATHIRRFFLQQPRLIEHYLDGAFSVDTMAANVDAVQSLLVRQGFDIIEAAEVYEVVTSYAIGNAIITTRIQRSESRGEHSRRLVEHGPDEFPYLRHLVAERERRNYQYPHFQERVLTVLAGIATCRGEPWEPIAALLEADASSSAEKEDAGAQNVDDTRPPSTRSIAPVVNDEASLAR